MLLEGWGEKIDGDLLDQQKVNEDVVYVKLFKFLRKEHGSLLNFWIDKKDELFSNHPLMKTVLDTFQDYQNYLETEN